MFESAELGHRIDKKTFDAEVPALREALLQAQFDLKAQGDFPLLILINGIEGAGKGETVKLLHEWMDPRHIQVTSFEHPSDEEQARPAAWRYWRQLPAKGQIGVFFGNWYSQMLQGRVAGTLDEAGFEHALDEAVALEQMLCNEGALVLKFWFHLSQQRMNARLEELEDDPQHSWRISPLDWHQSRIYEDFVRHGQRMVQRSNCQRAPWHVVEGFDHYYRSLTVGRILLASLQDALKARRKDRRDVGGTARVGNGLDQRRLLDSLDLSQRLDKAGYQQQLLTEQARLSRLMRDPKMKRHALVAVFEGNDAAGKGSAIRRVADALDPRQYRMVPIGAPSDEELAHPYLWRFWRHVPPHGRFTIFDRSWYGRVLVERVEGFAAPVDWQRAYGEINAFEEQLTEAGTILVKFWLAIDRDTQYERFKAREKTPFKRFKITDEDWRNREKWDDYVEAVDDMVTRTSTRDAPWTLVEANDKRYARIKVLRTLNEALERAFGQDG
ncbi:polyphosphate:AMP phosphotransferase [Stutzerimonas tarimensis]|uniref:Polyphosphate:AMP phosphotransferase n=1 Tax=Stutzerimonas tarimensis TaxID=1507735 RepID=A0ABV7T992_9GAMM